MTAQPATSRARSLGDAGAPASAVAASRWRDVSLWTILFAAFIILRLVGTRTPLIVDELIPLRVFESMDARGVLDPNWRLAELPAELKYDQYNFYFYNILAFFVLKLAALAGLAPFGALRVTNILLQGGAVILIADTMRRLGTPGWLRYEAAHQIAPSQRIDYLEILAGTVPKRCDMVAVPSYNDPRSERYVDSLRQAGYTPIGAYDGRFALLVTSTLHTYLDPKFYYFRCP